MIKNPLVSELAEKITEKRSMGKKMLADKPLLYNVTKKATERRRGPTVANCL